VGDAPRIRPTRAEDIDAVAAIYLSMARHHAALDPTEYRVPTLESVRERFAAELDAAELEDLHLVAEIDGLVVGQLDALGRGQPSPGSMRVPRRTATIGIAVLEGWRGRGIGTELLRTAEHWALNQGLDALVLDVATPNDGGRRLYERLGYVRVSEGMTKPLRHHRPAADG
jgi:ribosomal-protein-alanine N-acetyltransferase